jgi:hypothetical protein
MWRLRRLASAAASARRRRSELLLLLLLRCFCFCSCFNCTAATCAAARACPNVCPGAQALLMLCLAVACVPPVLHPLAAFTAACKQ